MVDANKGDLASYALSWAGAFLAVELSGMLCEFWAWRAASAVRRELLSSGACLKVGESAVIVDLRSASYDPSVAFDVLLRKLLQHKADHLPVAVLVQEGELIGGVKALPVKAAVTGFTVGVFSDRARAERYLTRQVRAIPGLRQDRHTAASLRTG